MPRAKKQEVQKRKYQRRTPQAIMLAELERAKQMVDEAETESQRIIGAAIHKFLAGK